MNYGLLYGEFGKYEILNGNILGAKKYYYKAGRVEMLLAKVYQDFYPQFKWKETPDSYCGSFYNGFRPFALSDNFEALIEFANYKERDKNDLNKNKEDLATCFAFKYLLIGDKNNANSLLGDSYKKIKPYFRGLSFVLAGILNEDINLIKTGILHEIKQHEKFDIKNWDIKFSESVTALLKLSRYYGYEVEIESPYIIKELLPFDNSIVYEDINEMYEALEIEGFSKKKWWSKLF